MDIIFAKRKILDLSTKNIREAYDLISEDEYKSILYAIKKHLPFKSSPINIASRKFLYYGAIKFDKFRIPSPFSVDDNKFNMFKLFLENLWLVEGQDSGNAPFLEIHKIKWELYSAYNLTNPQIIDHSLLDNYVIRLEKLHLVDYDTDKKEEFSKGKENIFSTIACLREGSIKTKISTRLPYCFTDKNSVISFLINGVEVVATTNIVHLGNNDTFFSTNKDSTIKTQGVSRWQGSYTELELVINALIDDSTYSKPLLFNYNNKPSDNWNYLYGITFEMIDKLWWYFKTNNISTTYWNPTPKDLPFISYAIWNNNDRIEFKQSQNPANIIEIKNIQKEEAPILNINHIENIPWYNKCYVYASMYKELGQFKESIFWLNVSVESLVAEFVDSVADESLKTELYHGIPVYKSSEEILSSQFPEMKGKVKWPDVVKHNSIFNIIDRTIKECKIPISKKEIHTRYSKIHSERNGLFHGRDNDITAEQLQKAFIAFDWLKEKLSQYIKQ